LRFILDVLETIVLSVLLFLAINAVSARIRVDGFSMEPTLLNGEFVIVNKLAYRIGEPSIGDVIVFHYPRDPEQEFIKRVIGLSGDDVRINAGQVYGKYQTVRSSYWAITATILPILTIGDQFLLIISLEKPSSFIGRPASGARSSIHQLLPVLHLDQQRFIGFRGLVGTFLKD
jgi:signal peptidase I